MIPYRFAILTLFLSLIMVSMSLPVRDSGLEEENITQELKSHTWTAKKIKPTKVGIKTGKAKAKCSGRHGVCRTFGPKPLACCEGLVCKVAYGEYHCFHSSESTQ